VVPLLRLQAQAGNRAITGMLAPLIRGDSGGRPRVAQREACLQDRARLGEGATGLSVGRVQRALVDLGYDLGTGADQRYGPKTA
jgi:peptidoglycan hydrolase-like protein with peptidoglycan-binding domain